MESIQNEMDVNKNDTDLQQTLNPRRSTRSTQPIKRLAFQSTIQTVLKNKANMFNLYGEQYWDDENELDEFRRDDEDIMKEFQTHKTND